MDIKYKIKTIFTNEILKPGILVSSIRGWIGYFAIHENSYEDECKPISVYIISDEEPKENDITLTINKYNIIGKAPQNIITDLISGIKKDGSEVKLSNTEYDFLMAPTISYDPQIDINGEVYCF